MAYNFFAPQPGRLGTLPIQLNSGRINTGTLAAGTQNHSIAASPTKVFFNKACIVAGTFPTAATSCTAQLIKLTGATTTALTNALDINAKTANVPLQFTLVSTLSDTDRTINVGDSIRLAIVTTGSVSVQPDDVNANVEVLVLQ